MFKLCQPLINTTSDILHIEVYDVGDKLCRCDVVYDTGESDKIVLSYNAIMMCHFKDLILQNPLLTIPIKRIYVEHKAIQTNTSIYTIFVIYTNGQIRIDECDSSSVHAKYGTFINPLLDDYETIHREYDNDDSSE